MEVWMWPVVVLGYLAIGIFIQRQLGLVEDIDEEGNIVLRPSVHRWNRARRAFVVLFWLPLGVLKPVQFTWKRTGNLQAWINWLLFGGPYVSRSGYYGYYHNRGRSSSHRNISPKEEVGESSKRP